MSDAIRIFTGPNDTDKRVGINAGAEDDPGDGALYVNGDIIADGGIYVDGGIFGALSASQSAVKIGGGAMPSDNIMALASNWKLDPGGGINGYRNIFHNEASLSAEGWYNVLVFNATSENARNFNRGVVIDFYICRTYSYGNNETYKVSFTSAYNNLQFNQEDGTVNLQYIDKIRYAYNGNTGYFQIHYNTTGSNPVVVECIVHASDVILSDFALGNLASGSGTSVAESPLSALQNLGTSSNYVKFGNGFMVQWGETTASTTLSQVASSGIYYGYFDITMPQAFLNNYFQINGISQYSTGHVVPIGYQRVSTSKFRAGIYDFYARNGNIRVAWQAIGRWK